MEKIIRKVDCITKDCTGIIEALWDSKDGFEKTRCPICKTLFEPYIETRLKLMEMK